MSKLDHLDTGAFLAKLIRRLVSVVCFGGAIWSCCRIFLVRGGGFIDFSDLERIVYGILSLLLMAAAVLIWKSDRRVWGARLAAWVLLAGVVAFGVFGAELYIPPAREIVAIEATVVDRYDEYIVLVPTVSTPDFSPDDRLQVSLKNNVPYPRAPEIGDRVLAFIYTDSLEGSDPIRVGDLNDIRILETAE